MIKPLQRQSPFAYGAKMLFLCARPLSTKVLCPTHWFINEAALTILMQAGYIEDVNFISPHLRSLQAGVSWADSGYKNISHFFNPTTKKGIFGFASAACDFIHYINKAAEKRQKGNMEDAIFYLGAAAHLLQDMCVPHHSAGLLFNGHKEYENWVEQNFINYFIPPAPIEEHFKKPFQLFFSNAFVSVKCINLVNKKNLKNYHETTRLLLPRAEYSTAGLLHWFTNKLSSFR